LVLLKLSLLFTFDSTSFCFDVYNRMFVLAVSVSIQTSALSPHLSTLIL
jgi:hypothetical protein